MTNKHWDLLLHCSSINTINDILKSKALLPRNKNSKYITVKGAEPFVYTTYIFDTMTYKSKLNNEPTFHGWYYGEDFIFIIDSVILKDLPFLVCNWMISGECRYDKSKLLIDSSGSLNKKPNMIKLKKHINNFITEYYDFYKYSFKYDKNEYVKYSPVPTHLSHEVLFNNIPLKYIKGILIPEYAKNSWYKKYNKQFEKFNVPIVFFKNDIGFNYIKMLEQFNK